MDPRSDLPALDRRRFSQAALSLGAFGFAVESACLAGRAVAAGVDLEASQADLQPHYPLRPRPGETIDDPVAAIMAYDPERDPDAAYFRSRTARAPRIAPFKATQAHPELDPRPQVASLWSAYGPLDPQAGEGFSRLRYGKAPFGGVYVSRMLAYHDIVVGWGGTGMIPNPAITDLAHRNGALCLGTIFQPDHRLYDSSTTPARTVAAKLVALAKYFGFDGYFVNFENGDVRSHAEILDFVLMMRRAAAASGFADFHIQFYDGGTAMAQLLPVRPVRHGGGPGRSFPNSVMLDQGWSGYGMFRGCCSGATVQAPDVRTYCRRHGFDPFKSAYFGFQLYPGPGYFSAIAPTVITPNLSGPAFGSLQLYSADDGLRTLTRLDRAKAAGGGAVATPEAAVGRGKLYALERQLFSGASENPAMDNAPSPSDLALYAPNHGERRVYSDYAGGLPKPTDQAILPISYGVANFITERSPIVTTPFVTHFNTGDGDKFFNRGERVSDQPWFNMGAQDILPTWQWRREPLAGRLDPFPPTPLLLGVDYDFETAFDGGSSLRIFGRIGPGTATRIWLYKTALKLGGGDPGQILSLVVKGVPTAGDVPFQVGLVFQDRPDVPVWIGVEPGVDAHAALPNGWRRVRISLAPYGGRTMAAILLGCPAGEDGSAQTEVNINVGELYIGPGDLGPAMAPPGGFAIDAFRPSPDGRSAQARLRWTYDDGAAYYDLFYRLPDSSGARVWVGRIDGDRYYCSDLPWREGQGLTLELVGVAKASPLSSSPPARIVLGQD